VAYDSSPRKPVVLLEPLRRSNTPCSLLEEKLRLVSPAASPRGAAGGRVMRRSPRTSPWKVDRASPLVAASRRVISGPDEELGKKSRRLFGGTVEEEKTSGHFIGRSENEKQKSRHLSDGSADGKQKSRCLTGVDGALNEGRRRSLRLNDSAGCLTEEEDKCRRLMRGTSTEEQKSRRLPGDAGTGDKEQNGRGNTQGDGAVDGQHGRSRRHLGWTMTEADIFLYASPARPTSPPARIAASPARPAASPARHTASPVLHAASPARPAASPARHTASPVRHTASPARQTASQSRQTDSPARHTASHARHTSAQARPTTSLAGPSSSPARSTSSVARPTASPARSRSSPAGLKSSNAGEAKEDAEARLRPSSPADLLCRVCGSSFEGSSVNLGMGHRTLNMRGMMRLRNSCNALRTGYFFTYP
jgi:hypothetical protein